MARRTPLYERHRSLGARIVEFAGWDMPVSYAGALEEHRAVRERCGLFDVSHMGEIELRGGNAVVACERLTVNAVHRLRDGDGQYSLLCNEEGGVLDDLIVYRLQPDRLLLVVNAANTSADLAWVRAHAGVGVDVVDRSDETALLALQGPAAEDVLHTVTAFDLGAIRPFTVHDATVAGRPAMIARTGYTGEDGFEIVLAADDAGAVWDALVAEVRRAGGHPCGLAARDTLRLEAGLPLCGTDMDATTTPLEAGLSWVVKLGKGEFIGRAALQRQHEAGIPRRLVGFVMDDPGIPRHGHPVWADDEEIGRVTSGTKSPTLGTFIGVGYVTRAHAAARTPLAIDVRGRRLAAHVVDRPFYRRPRRTKES